MAWEGRKRPTQADHPLPATATSLFMVKSSAKTIMAFFKESTAKELQASLWERTLTKKPVCQKPNGRSFSVASEAVQWKVVLARAFSHSLYLSYVALF